MIQEAYVSFEVAKLLKEKGFDEPTLAYTYGQDMINYYSRPRVTDSLSIEAGIIPLPTQQMAMRWLREEHSLLISINIGIYGGEKEILWDYIVVKINKAGLSYPQVDASFCFNTYEEACEAAIKYCLKNLI